MHRFTVWFVRFYTGAIVVLYVFLVTLFGGLFIFSPEPETFWRGFSKGAIEGFLKVPFESITSAEIQIYLFFSIVGLVLSGFALQALLQKMLVRLRVFLILAFALLGGFGISGLMGGIAVGLTMRKGFKQYFLGEEPKDVQTMLPGFLGA